MTGPQKPAPATEGESIPATKQGKPIISHDRMLSLVLYNPETGVFTRLKESGLRKAGSVMGCRTRFGYTSIGIDGVDYRAARLAHFYMTKCWPAFFMDHINGVRWDDRWCNLREATPAQNSANRQGVAASKMPLKGVFRDKHRRKWRSSIQVGKKVIHLGAFETPEEAHAAYLREAEKIHGEYARRS